MQYYIICKRFTTNHHSASLGSQMESLQVIQINLRLPPLHYVRQNIKYGINVMGLVWFVGVLRPFPESFTDIETTSCPNTRPWEDPVLGFPSPLVTGNHPTYTKYSGGRPTIMRCNVQCDGKKVREKHT